MIPILGGGWGCTRLSATQPDWTWESLTQHLLGTTQSLPASALHCCITLLAMSEGQGGEKSGVEVLNAAGFE